MKREMSAVSMNAKEATTKLAAIREFQKVVRASLSDGHDYGVIPGTPKPTLLKPGAEKIAKLLNLSDDYLVDKEEERWDRDDPFFYYRVRCILRDMETGTMVSSGVGSCNSQEVKYAWRWVPEADLPKSFDKASLESKGGERETFEFDFALSKRETTGKYGKPAEYWDAWDKAIKEGKAKRGEKDTKGGKTYPGYSMMIGRVEYRIPNPAIFDQVNTILKMAKKRALVDAALSVGRLSDLFTQDIEDISGFAGAEEPPSKPGPPAESSPREKAKGPEAPKEEEPPVYDGDEAPFDLTPEEGKVELTGSQMAVQMLMDKVVTAKKVTLEVVRRKLIEGEAKIGHAWTNIPGDLDDAACGRAADFLSAWAKKK
jgi:hypothetical protein